MAAPIEQSVRAIKGWKAWDAASASPILHNLSVSDAWLPTYFARDSTVRNARRYIGPAIVAIKVPRIAADLPGKEVLRVEVMERFSLNDNRRVFLVVGHSGLEWSACGTVQNDGSVKKGCIGACVSLRYASNSLT